MLATVYPPDLAAHGLPSALRELTRIATSQGVRAEVAVDERFQQPPNVEALLYRAAQEGLRNAAAHAGAQRVTVSAGTENGRAWLEVADDGQGFDPEGRAEVGHLGLRALQDLLDDADGQLTISSSPGHGTVLRAHVPTA
jgi:signal transduction histidine kinase